MSEMAMSIILLSSEYVEPGLLDLEISPAHSLEQYTGLKPQRSGLILLLYEWDFPENYINSFLRLILFLTSLNSWICVWSNMEKTFELPPSAAALLFAFLGACIMLRQELKIWPLHPYLGQSCSLLHLKG